MRNDGEWTEGRWRSFVVAALRSATRRWPPKYKTLANACTGAKVNSKTGRTAKHYKCNICNNEFPQKEVEVDHIHPVVDLQQGFISWDDYIDKMFCNSDNLQVLCKPCHKLKTKEENAKFKRVPETSVPVRRSKRTDSSLPSAGTDGGSRRSSGTVRKSSKKRGKPPTKRSPRKRIG